MNTHEEFSHIMKPVNPMQLATTLKRSLPDKMFEVASSIQCLDLACKMDLTFLLLDNGRMKSQKAWVLSMQRRLIESAGW